MKNLTNFWALPAIASTLTVGVPPTLAQTVPQPAQPTAPPEKPSEGQVQIQTQYGTITVKAELCVTRKNETIVPISAVVTPILPAGFGDVPEVQKQQTIFNLTSGVYIVQSNQSDAARQVLTTLIPAWASVPRNDIPVTCPENTSTIPVKTIPVNFDNPEQVAQWLKFMSELPAKQLQQ
jgi:hypothetical protein